MYRYVKPVQLEEGKIRLEGKIGHRHTPGNMWVGTFAGRENPGIFGNQSKNLTLEKVTLYHTPSMGVICQLCENVTMVELKTVPRPDSGRFLSVNADATHFVHCTGAIRYEGCTFTNMLDDAGNVHGNYTKIDKKLSSTSLLAEFGHFQQRGVNPYSPGDRIHIVDNHTLLPICTLTVKSARLLSSRWVRLETEEPLPEIRKGYTVENFTKMPELYIHNCVCGYNRPRGFLPGTWKKTVITHNTFFNMMHAVAFTGDCNDWFESGPVSDVLIRHNQFRNASYTGGAVIDISPRVKEGTAPFHKNIRIEDNVFELHEKRFLSAHHVENLTMEGNTFIENPSLPRHPPIGDSGVYLENCPHAEIQLPAEEKREKKSQ